MSGQLHTLTKLALPRQQQILQEHQEVRDALTKKLIEVETSRDSTESPAR